MGEFKRKRALLSFASRDAEIQYIIAMRGVKSAAVIAEECGLSDYSIWRRWKKYCFEMPSLNNADPDAKKQKVTKARRKRVLSVRALAKPPIKSTEPAPKAKRAQKAGEPAPFKAGDLRLAQTRIKAIKFRAQKVKEAQIAALKKAETHQKKRLPLPDTAVLIVDLDENKCKFPFWEDCDTHYHQRFYCGAPVVEGRIYCAECLKKMYTTARKPSEAKRPFVIKESRYAA
jgi:hypothetical protein